MRGLKFMLGILGTLIPRLLGVQRQQLQSIALSETCPFEVEETRWRGGMYLCLRMSTSVRVASGGNARA